MTLASARSSKRRNSSFKPRSKSKISVIISWWIIIFKKVDFNMTTKEYVLKTLEENKGCFITGMELSSALGVSRNAIWKAINELKKDGYNIYSVNNKGYALDESSDILSVTAIKEQMLSYYPNIKAVGNAPSIDKKEINKIADSIIIYDEVDSTNQLAKLELITGALDKKIIIAKKQYAGKGHNRKSFSSPEGGIYLSIILDDKDLLKAKSQKPFKSSAIGAIVKRNIEELTGKNAALDKQFNRLSIGNKNICGILTEYFADMETNTINSYIIGIGIKNITIPKNEIVARVLLDIYGIL